MTEVVSAALWTILISTVFALAVEKLSHTLGRWLLYFPFLCSCAFSLEDHVLFSALSLVISWIMFAKRMFYYEGNQRKCEFLSVLVMIFGIFGIASSTYFMIWWVLATVCHFIPGHYLAVTVKDPKQKDSKQETDNVWVSTDDENLLEKLSEAYTAQTSSAETRNTNIPCRDSRCIDKCGYYDYSRQSVHLSETEQQWEMQIRSGNLPVYQSLKEDNQSDFFISMKVSGRSGQFIDLKSQRFGDATNALAFARSLRYNLACPCVVRKAETGNGYIVIASSADSYLLEKNESAVKNTYEFRNPFYNVYESPETDEFEEGDEPDDTESPKPYTNGLEYEQYIAMRMRIEGFKNVEVTPASGDFGADIIFEREGVKFCAQCKLYSKPVGISAVQEIIGAKAHYNCAVAMVITNNTYTDAARQLAKENAVILVDEFK